MKIKNGATLLVAGALSASIAIPVYADWGSNEVSVAGKDTWIYMPSSDPATNPKAINGMRALMLNLHGCGQSNEDMKVGGGWESTAEDHSMVVAVPYVGAGRGIYHCWDYHLAADGMNNGQELVNMVNELVANASYNIDPSQVYISGLSSGGAMSAQVACQFPQVFAGIGAVAGPSVGSNQDTEALGNTPIGNVSRAINKCNALASASGHADKLGTQITSIGYGDMDKNGNGSGSGQGTTALADVQWNLDNAEVMSAVYGVGALGNGTMLIDETGREAEVKVVADGDKEVVSLVKLLGVGHAWPGGSKSTSGAGGNYVNHSGYSYSTWLTEWLFANNRRVITNLPPEVDGLTLTVSGNQLVVGGTATDADGSVSAVTITISSLATGAPELVETINTNVDASDLFNVTSGSLPDAAYEVVAVATDNEDKGSAPEAVTERVGPPPPATAPQLSNTTTSVNGQCATVSGTVFDVNFNLDDVIVTFSNGSVTATVDGTSYSAEQCNLPGGTNSATITATDTGDLSSTDSVSFDIDAGSTGDYNHHINEGHIAWGDGYSACYLEFGTAAFTMREVDAGSGQCEWVADGAAACNGPVQSCAGGGTNNDADGDGVVDSADNCPNDANADQEDSDSDGLGNICDETPNGEDNGNCEDVSAYNYYHKTGGRAYSSGSVLTPDYFANGSDDAMAGSTWGYSTLHSSDGGSVWSLGACP